jgi:dienelactone hydrolase
VSLFFCRQGQRVLSSGGRALLCAIVGLVLLLSATTFADPGPSPYFGPRLVREDVRILAPGGYTIATTILRPEGPGPYGAVVLNHGFPGTEEERQAESWQVFSTVAPVFARRGWAVVMPMRRGFGATGGEAAEDPGLCRRPQFQRGEAAAAEDVMAAYEYARSLAYVDPSRMMLAGQSAGGMVSLYTAGMHAPEGLLAVLTFAAGRGGDPDRNPGVPCAVEALAKVFDALGPRVKVPVLLNYAENDRFFGSRVTRGWFERFAAGGVQAQYVLQPSYGRDGHFLFTQLAGVEYWLPTVERFLASHGVPFQRLDAQDPRAVPLLQAKVPTPGNEGCGSLYRVFLESPGPRAYAVSTDGHCGFAGGMRDASQAAMHQCGQIATERCMLYAVDDRLVWKERGGTLNAGL